MIDFPAQISDVRISNQEFVHLYSQNPKLVMWFLGAGTSRSAGMPTAADITWDLKRQYYCLKEAVDIDSQDLSNKSIRMRIQSYMDAQGFPVLWSSEEYSFYFELLFQNDYQKQQRYLNSVLSSNKISLNVGHRILAAMMGTELTNLVFTTNFDDVIETAYASVFGKNLHSYHLEGSYAALEAFNTKDFPVYTKIHGDFRYQKIKNITVDLQNNDKQLMSCFLAASVQYGLVVSGYSGRDTNVMDMLNTAIQQNNAFPRGLFWTVFNIKDTAQNVIDLIVQAKEKGIIAAIVETGTFDETMTKLWKQIPDKNPDIKGKITPDIKNRINIPLPEPGNSYPVVRTNALPVISMPKLCGLLKHKRKISHQEVIEVITRNKPQAVISHIDDTIFFGSTEVMESAFGQNNIDSFSRYEIADPVQAMQDSTHLTAFYERSLINAICQNKPLNIIKKGTEFFAYIRHSENQNEIFEELKKSVGFRGSAGYITGSIPGLQKTFWAEAVSIKLDIKNNNAWLLLQPDIWINPVESRRDAIEFLKRKKLQRWNAQQNSILDSWIRILFGSLGIPALSVCLYPETKFPAEFKICTRTAYSQLYRSENVK
jgi:hypothetical protein